MKSLFLLTALAGTLLFAETSKLDEKSGLVWQDNQAIAKTELGYDQAVAYCRDLVLDGFDDWRLPGIKEFYTIIDLSRDRPALKKGFEVRIDERFWTVTPFVDHPEKEAWRISMTYGEAEPYKKSRSYHVRCVRGVARH
jgi:hypothetical protein